MTNFYIKAISRWWWAILIFTFAVSAIAYFIVVRNLPDNYQSSTKLFVAPASSSALANVYDAPYTDRAVKTVSLLAQGDEFIAQLAGQTGYSIDDIKDSIKVNYIVNTQIIEIDITKNNFDFVTAVSHALPEVLEKHIMGIQESTDTKNQIKISTAETNSVPHLAPPFKWQIMLAIALISLFAAFLVVYLIEYFYDTLDSEFDLEKIRLKHLGNFGLLKNLKNSVWAIKDKENQHTAEMLREISTNLNFLQSKEHIKSIMVTSANPREGKTLFIANLAIILAQTGKKVALVDCDLRKPFLNKAFSQENGKGLADYLLNKGGDILRKTDIDNLFLITAGSRVPNPSEIFDVAKLKELKTILAKDWKIDFVLFDTPPVAVINDAAVISQATDGVILVAEKGRTKMKDLKRIKDIFDKLDTNVLGAVITKTKNNQKVAYYYG